MADTQKNAAAVTTEEKPAENAEPSNETAGNAVETAEGTAVTAESSLETAGNPTEQEAKKPAARKQDLEYFIDKVENPDTREYIRTRVVDQMNYYRKQSRAYKKQYFHFMTASIVLGALIPIASIFSDATALMKCLIAALGSAVTAINAYLALYNSRDLWLSYRNSRQSLHQTLNFYFFNTNMFENIETQEERDRLLVQNCEEELVNQHNIWRTLVEE